MSNNTNGAALGPILRKALEPYRRYRWTAIIDAPWQLQLLIVMILLVSCCDALRHVILFGISFSFVAMIVVPVMLVPIVLYSSRIRWLIVLFSAVVCCCGFEDLSGFGGSVMFTSVVALLLILSKPCRLWYRQHHTATKECAVGEMFGLVSRNLFFDQNKYRKVVVFVLVLNVALYLWGAFSFTSSNVKTSVKAESTTMAESATVSEIANDEYLQLKMWYDSQLEYNDLREQYFFSRLNSEYGDSYYLILVGPSTENSEIRLENMQYLSYPKSMAKGFAQKLIESRIKILKYEDPDAGKKDVEWFLGKKMGR